MSFSINNLGVSDPIGRQCLLSTYLLLRIIFAPKRKMSGEKVQPNPKKAELRADVVGRLLAMTDDDRERQSKIILEKILAHPKFRSAKRVSLFLSMPNEVPTEPLLQDIILRGDAAFVPQYSKGKMRMLRLMPGDQDIMVETSWKIKQHAKEAEREDATENGGLELVIAPGAAFTRDGWRCGHGGGYYDRFLTSLIKRHEADPQNFKRPYILAIGFNQQIYPEIPVDKQDVRVNEIMTAD